jgi:hypothetical protein
MTLRSARSNAAEGNPGRNEISAERIFLLDTAGIGVVSS